MTKQTTPSERAAARAFQRGKSLPEIAKLLGRSTRETDRWLDSPALAVVLKELPPYQGKKKVRI